MQFSPKFVWIHFLFLLSLILPSPFIHTTVLIPTLLFCITIPIFGYAALMNDRTSSSTLSQPAFLALVNILDDIHRPLGHLSRRLWDSQLVPTSQLALASTIAALLQHDLLPKPSQRLVAIYILYDIIVSPQSTNQSTVSASSYHHVPSIPPTSTSTSTPSPVDSLIQSPLTIILFELVDDAEKRLPEQLFLSHLLTHSQTAPPTEAPIPAQISQAAADTLWNALEDAMRSGAAVPKLNITSLRKLWQSHHPHPSNTNSSSTDNSLKSTPYRTLDSVSAIIPDPHPPLVDQHSCLSDHLDTVVTLEDFVPPFVRIPPPLLPISTDSRELRWVDPEPLHDLIWDPGMGSCVDRGTELRQIISKALKSPIPERLQNQVIAQLDADPKLVHLCGLTPQNLSVLVDNNYMLAAILLLKLMNSKQMPLYFDALVKMDVNLHSIQVVTHISQTARLPSDFLHTYISNAIRSCGLIQDKSAKARMVRCVCSFLKTLIRSRTVEIDDLHVEIQAFCIEHSRMRDVADLYLILKNNGPQ